MADPVKSDEIEDVLSSIRRLVTEHQTPAASTEGGEGPAPQALVLTPALRVTDPEDPWVPIAPRAELSEGETAGGETAEDAVARGDGVDWAQELWGDENSGTDPDFDPQLRADIWEVEDGAETGALAQAEAGTEAVSPTGEDAPGPEEKSLFHPAPDTGAGDLADELASEPAGETIEAEAFVAPHPDAGQMDAAEDDPADPETGMTEAAETPDGALPEPDDRARAEDGQNSPEEEEAPLSFIRSSSHIADYEPAEGEPAAEDEAPPIATLELAEARAAQLAVAGVLSELSDPDETGETASQGAPSVEAAEEDDGGQGAESPVDLTASGAEPGPAPEAAGDGSGGIAQQDAPQSAPEDAEVEMAAEVEDLGEAPFSFPDDEDSFVDEEMLREIIAEVVREELQGEMGKRMTRNIRKLVRREIRLALAADELED